VFATHGLALTAQRTEVVTAVIRAILTWLEE